MKYFKQLLILSLLVVTGLLVFQSSQASAFDPFHRATGGVKVNPVCGAGTGGAVGCGKYTADPFSGKNGVIIKAALLLDWVVGAASVAIMLYAGLQYIMSRGDAQKAVNARNTMLYASIGLIVAVMAQGIIAFSLNRLF